MAITFLDRVQFTVSGAPGTGAITPGSVVPGFQTIAAAGGISGQTYSYSVTDAGNAWEYGHGAWNGTTLTRTTVLASSSGGSAISMTTAAIVTITQFAEDFAASATVDATNATNITSGTLPAARMSAANIETALGFTPSATPGAVLLATLTASNSATLSDTTHLTATYAEYNIIFENLIPAATSQVCKLQVQVSGSYQTSGYLSQNVSVSNATVTATTVTTYIGCGVGVGLVGNTAPGVSGQMHVSNPSGTSAPKTFFGVFSSYFNSNYVTIEMSGGFYNTTGAVTGFQVLFDGGNITSGVIKIYGYN